MNDALKQRIERLVKQRLGANNTSEDMALALRVAVDGLELTLEKTETDPAGEVELRARAAFLYGRTRTTLTELSRILGVEGVDK